MESYSEMFEHMLYIMGKLVGYRVIAEDKLTDCEFVIREWLLERPEMKEVIRADYPDEEEFNEYIEGDFSIEMTYYFAKLDESVQEQAIEVLRGMMVRTLN